MDQVPCRKVAEYSGEDADVAWRLAELLEPQLRDLRSLYDDLEIPLIGVLADMEFTGIRLDVPYLKSLAIDMERQLAELETRIYELAGRRFNIASVKQVREALLKEQGLRSDRKTMINREASTDQESLEAIGKTGARVTGQLVKHRQVAKLKGTYVDSLPALVNPSTGRVHASFNQTVASTGRPQALKRSEPAKHSDSHRAGREHPQGVSAGTGLEASLGRLFAG